MSMEIHDGKERWRCPPIGGPVPFRHCRTTNEGLPCRKIAECWGAEMDIASFLKENYTIGEMEKAFGGEKKGRMEVVMEALKEARKA